MNNMFIVYYDGSFDVNKIKKIVILYKIRIYSEENRYGMCT